ncbi:3-carboxyethylcatechol 2,3-dioxygenase [Tomitella biformata]|uniref:3-carboxyethylcatechol 2,3-dioxygenase n=1 Tax=Tomitella biformata TaxID=630403 RepID=UPI0004660ED8|nr:3-carboxyethylcatechol 2,3-dioxygenase [Tomitella biformata]
MTNQDRLVVCASHGPGMERDVERVQGTTFRAGLARATAMVAEFDPDYIVLFGGDHRRAFRQLVPAVAVVLSGGIMAEAGHDAAPLDIPGDIARELAEHLLGAGFDITAARDVELDHAFGQPLRDLGGAVAAYPVIPVPINCATAPLPTARRVLELGAEVGRFLDGRAERVLVIASGGLSHSPPSLEVDAYDISAEERARINAEGMPSAGKKIKPEWDREFLAALGAWDVDALAAMADSAQANAGAGANEVRTWLAAGAAGGGRGLESLVYEPVEEWIIGMAVAVTATA